MILQDFIHNVPLIAAAVLVAIVGVGRVTRLVTYDDYPPTVAIRSWWNRLTHGNGWSKLAFCLWCFSPWAMLFCLAWFFVGLLWVPWLVIAWWFFWGWMALSYLSAILVRHDEPEE